MKKTKGFTLIELMIVIAIIGILAVVLIPKIGGIKTQTKLAGLDTNLNVAVGVTQAMIQDFDANATELTSFENQIASRLSGNPDKDPENPLTGETGVADLSGSGDPSVSAFVYDPGDSTVGTGDELVDNAEAFTVDSTYAGTIVFDAYDDGGVKVEFIPVDDAGNLMTQKATVVAK